MHVVYLAANVAVAVVEPVGVIVDQQPVIAPVIADPAAELAALKAELADKKMELAAKTAELAAMKLAAVAAEEEEEEDSKPSPVKPSPVKPRLSRLRLSRSARLSASCLPARLLGKSPSLCQRTPRTPWPRPRQETSRQETSRLCASLRILLVKKFSNTSVDVTRTNSLNPSLLR